MHFSVNTTCETHFGALGPWHACALAHSLWLRGDSASSSAAKCEAFENASHPFYYWSGLVSHNQRKKLENFHVEIEEHFDLFFSKFPKPYDQFIHSHIRRGA